MTHASCRRVVQDTGEEGGLKFLEARIGDLSKACRPLGLAQAKQEALQFGTVSRFPQVQQMLVLLGRDFRPTTPTASISLATSVLVGSPGAHFYRGRGTWILPWRTMSAVRFPRVPHHRETGF